MCIKQRDDVCTPLMLVDSEPKKECCHSLNWVKTGKAKQNMGGVKQVSNPHVRVKDKTVYHSNMEYFPHLEVPTQL